MESPYPRSYLPHMSTPTSPPRQLSLPPSSPFANPFATPIYLTPHTPSTSTLFEPSPSLSHLSAASIRVARVAERRGVNLVEVIDLAGLGAGYLREKSSHHLLAPSFLPSPDDRSSVLAYLGDASPPYTPRSMSPSPSTSTEPASPPEALPPMDESFMRWSRTASTIFSEPSTFYYNGKRSTGHHSELQPPFSSPVASTSVPVPGSETVPPPSSFPNPLSHPLTASPGRPDHKRRESTNSAGTFGNRQRRWSALNSTTSVAAGDDFSPVESPNETPIDEDVQFGSTSSRTRSRRPLSMSSASDSAFSGQPTGERLHIGRSNISGATFPSPTLRRPTHKTPESTAEITAHLLKASGTNESRIVPRLIPTSPSPSSRTPILDMISEETGKRSPKERHKPSKLDQVLGEGAETARVLMEFERRDRRAVQDVVEMPAVTRLPPPPRHRPSTAPTPSSIPILPPTPPSAYSRTEDTHFSHGRSNSIDSLSSSLHPSLTESAHLIPSSAPFKPTDKQMAKLYAIAKPEVHNDLSPEQRTILLRRTRKIEQMLGEPLSELKVGEHVVGPSRASTMVHTSREEWPPSPTAVRSRVPEYEQQDCQPRTVRVLDRSLTPAAKGKTTMASKAMAVLGLGEKKEGDLRVYVTREQTVSEVVQRGYQQPSSPRKSDQSDEPRSPVPEGYVDDEEVMKKARRSQVAKLSRLLGEPVPASAFHPPPPDSPAQRPSTPQRSASSNGVSFISFEDDVPSPSWKKRMRSAVVNVMEKEKDKDRPTGSSFWDGSLKRDDSKGKKRSTSPPTQAGESFGNRGVERSFMDLRHSRSSERDVGMGGSYGAKRASVKQAGAW